MRWTTQATACLMAIALAGCNGRRDTGAAPATGGGTETGTMSDTSGMSSAPAPGMSADSGMNATTDTGQSGMQGGAGTEMSRDSNARPSNQTESGMTDSTGKSTLGNGAEKTRPDQGQPVTSKGDTINPGVDSAR